MKNNNKKRKYLPTLAELIDRLSICMLKKIYISTNTSKYQKEIEDIKYDINLITNVNAEVIEAIMLIMLTNRVIWENESAARSGIEFDLQKLKFTHSINGVRNIAKNKISEFFGERIDLKIDCLASDLPKEFGNWDYYNNNLKNAGRK